MQASCMKSKREIKKKELKSKRKSQKNNVTIWRL